MQKFVNLVVLKDSDIKPKVTQVEEPVVTKPKRKLVPVEEVTIKPVELMRYVEEDGE